MNVFYGLTLSGRPSGERKVGFKRFWKAASIATFLLAMLTAIGSYRYVLGLPPMPDGITANAFRTPWLMLHAGSASTALLLGTIQFTAVSKWGGIPAHRMVGRIYVVSCLIGSISGLVLAVGSSAGILASLGFGSLSLAWALANIMGWQHAVSRRIVMHSRWMIRSWALTLSAVTLRMYLAISEMAELPEATSYVTISFLCWLPNLIVAEWMLRAGRPVSDFAPSSSLDQRVVAPKRSDRIRWIVEMRLTRPVRDSRAPCACCSKPPAWDAHSRRVHFCR